MSTQNKFNVFEYVLTIYTLANEVRIIEDKMIKQVTAE